MKTTKIMNLLPWILLLTVSTVFAQATKEATGKNEPVMTEKTMNTYVIEREIPNARSLGAGDLQGISKTSCSVLKDLGSGIEWLHSYVTDNKIYCVYRAENEEILREHAAKGGFPINSVQKLSTVISPETATAALTDIIR